MEATRARFGSALEWILAAAFIVIAFVIGSIALRELRTVSPTLPVIAHEAQAATAAPPAGVPARRCDILPAALSAPVIPLHPELA